MFKHNGAVLVFDIDKSKFHNLRSFESKRNGVLMWLTQEEMFYLHLLEITTIPVQLLAMYCVTQPRFVHPVSNIQLVQLVESVKIFKLVENVPRGLIVSSARNVLKLNFRNLFLISFKLQFVVKIINLYELV